MKSTFRRLLAVPALVLAATTSHALTVGTADPQGDFLPTFSSSLSKTGDLDVLFAYGLYDQASSSFTFGATFAAPVGGAGSSGLTHYIWGIDRGLGTERLNTGATPVGAGVKFDAVINLDNIGGGVVSRLAVGSFAAGTTALSPGAVVISGNTITVTVAASLLPSTGFALNNYAWNVWPRVGTGNNNQISDFAPDASSLSVLAVTPVPEPDTTAMLLAGLGLVGMIARRRAGMRSKV